MNQLAIGLSAAAGIATIAFGAGYRAGEADSLFLDARYGFSIEPPAFEDDGEVPVVTIATFQAPPAGGFAASMNIQRQVFEGGLEKFVAISIAQFESAKLEVTESKAAQVGKHAAHEFVYSGAIGGSDLTFHGLAVEDGDHVLLLTCTAKSKDFEDVDKAFDDSLASLKLDE